MEQDLTSVESAARTPKPILNLQAEALSAGSLKQFFETNKAAIDTDKDGFVVKGELDKFKSKLNPISREHRLAEALGERVHDVEVLSRDEASTWDWFENNGITYKDMAALDAKARTSPNDRLVKSINDGLAAKDYEHIVRSASELTEDRLHLVDLKFKKHSFSLDPFKHIGNELKAESQTTVVGERQFDKYKVGEELSRQGDVAGFLFNGDFDSYSVSVAGKRVETAYGWVDSQNQARPLRHDIYKELKSELGRQGRTTWDVPYSGSTHTYISDQPLSAMNVVKREPLNRYFLDVEISNSSMTFDLVKHLRNATTSHRVEMEVPQNLYANTKSTWNPHLSTGSFLLGGRVSSMHGEVKDRRTEVDKNFEQVTTDKGRRFIVPKPNR